VEDHDRRARGLGEAAHAGDGLDLGFAGAGGGVVDGPCATFGQQAGAGLGDDGVVFGMDAGERARVARDGERAEDLPVVEADIVGGEDLEGAVALRDQRGEVGLVIGRPRVGEDQVEGVVDGRPARAPRRNRRRRPRGAGPWPARRRR
jgi:hypothetical protein